MYFFLKKNFFLFVLGCSYRCWALFRKSAKIKSGKRAQPSIFGFSWKQTYVFLWGIRSSVHFLRELVSFVDKPDWFFITFYQITNPCSDAFNFSRTISATQRPCVCCAIEYSFLKRNLYGFVQNFSRTIFVRFNTNLNK